MTEAGLDSRRSILIRISAALAARDLEQLTGVLQEAFQLNDPTSVEEVLLQSYLFLGYPIALNAFSLWRDMTGVDSGDGVPDDWEGWEKRGGEICRSVYGGQYDGLRRNVRALHPDMERWMVVEGYGKVLGRPELDLATRELCIAALLAVLRTPRQLYSHLRGALNGGAHPSEVEGALRVASHYMDAEDREEAWAVWDRVLARTSGPGPDRRASRRSR